MAFETPKIRTIKMTIQEWDKVPDNPIQRAIEPRAIQYSRPGQHLSAPHMSHAKVVAAELPSGKLIKVDGHTRAFMWIQGMLEHPKKVLVDLYPVKNMEEAKALYRTFDNKAATESDKQKIYGACNELGFHPRCSLFYSGAVLSSCKVMVFPNKYADTRALTVTDLLKPHIPAFKHIDSMADVIRNHSLFPSYLITAMIMSVTAHGLSACSFWEAYALDEGHKSAREMDGIFATRKMFDEIRHAPLRSWGYGLVTHLTPVVLHYFDAWRTKKKLTVGRGGKGVPAMGIRKNSPEIMSMSVWWRTYIGDYYYSQIRRAESEPVED